MKKYLKIFNTRKSSAGFTLTELLLAAGITTVVIGAAGAGLANMLGVNRTANAQTERRMELNRALDFIADEVKMARAIEPDVNIDVHAAQAPNFDSDCDNPGDGVDCALILQIPGVSQRVIYYVASPPDGSPWRGPRVIYRWGPNFNANGTYSNANNPSNWNPEPLVDRIEGNLESPYYDPCPAGWSPNLPADDRDSFYACVDPTSKIAQVFLLGQFGDTNNRSTDRYVANTMAFARNSDTTPTGVGGNPVFALTPDMTINTPSTVNFQVLGSSITCGPGGPTVPVRTEVQILDSAGNVLRTTTAVNGTFTDDVEPGNKVRVVGTAQLSSTITGYDRRGNPIYCRSSNITYDSSNTQQVITLRDGERPPAGFTPFNNQPSIESYTRNYIKSDGTVDIGSDQAIYFYELGETNPSSEAFDMQDLVVLGTVDPR